MTNLQVDFEDGSSLILEPYDPDQRWLVLSTTAKWLNLEHYAYFILDDPQPGQKMWLVIWMRQSDRKNQIRRTLGSESMESPTPVRRVTDIPV